VMLKAGVDAAQAQTLLDAAHGSIRQALQTQTT
jgi:N-acetylmuramic acid 6-phosphate (MurNAc-6-P) etherase